jgi:hypothetical protein
MTVTKVDLEIWIHGNADNHNTPNGEVDIFTISGTRIPIDVINYINEYLINYDAWDIKDVIGLKCETPYKVSLEIWPSDFDDGYYFYNSTFTEILDTI